MQDIVITYKYMISNAKRTKIVKANFILKERASFKMSFIRSWIRSYKKYISKPYSHFGNRFNIMIQSIVLFACLTQQLLLSPVGLWFAKINIVSTSGVIQMVSFR